MKDETGHSFCFKNVHFFEDFTPEQRDWFHKIARQKTYLAGETIYFPGEPKNSLYVVAKGKVKCFDRGPDGKRLTYEILGKGALFGALDASHSGRHRHFAEALTDAALCTVDRTHLSHFMEKFPNLSMKFASIIGIRGRILEQKLEDVVFKSVLHRLSSLLVKLAREFGAPCPCPLSNGWIHIPLNLTQQDLADMVGSTRETTSMKLNQLKRQELIHYCHIGDCESCEAFSKVIVIPNLMLLEASSEASFAASS